MGIMAFLGQGLEAGASAPDFALPDQFGKTHRLSDYRGQRFILYFYPRDFTRGCTAEACSFRDEFASFRDAPLPIVGVSVDTVEQHAKFAHEYKIPFALLADFDKEVSKLYEVLLPLGVANRVTFLIDENLKIVKVLKWLSWKNYAVETREALAALGWI
jgi:peroxiredoxin Q/BCP